MYELTCDSIIHQQQFSSVYEVTNVLDNSTLALKIADDVMNEVAVMTNVQSNHLIKGYAYGYCVRPRCGERVQFCERRRGAVPYLLMEKGELSLASVDNSIDPLTILRDASAGLMNMHEAGFVHCDIKDGNMLLMSDGRIVLCDFGISCHVNDLCKADRQLCTQGFKPPESLYRDPSQYTPAIDIWSLGMIMHTRLYGPAFSQYARHDDVATLNSMIDWYATGQQSLQYRGDIGELLLRMLEWSPHDRPSAREVHDCATQLS